MFYFDTISNSHTYYFYYKFSYFKNCAKTTMILAKLAVNDSEPVQDKFHQIT